MNRDSYSMYNKLLYIALQIHYITSWLFWKKKDTLLPE